MIARTLDETLAPITDGCVLAVAREVSGVAMAATRALIRRGKSQAGPLLTHGALQLDPAGCSINWEGRPVDLSAREFAVLTSAHGRANTAFGGPAPGTLSA